MVKNGYMMNGCITNDCQLMLDIIHVIDEWLVTSLTIVVHGSSIGCWWLANVKND
jgi:hypothetical protein